MRSSLFLLAFVAGSLLSSCAASDVKTTSVNLPQNTVVQDSQAAVPVSTQPKDGNYPGKGKVTKINMDLGSVELDHQEIVGVMPAMIMEFYVRDKSMLTSLAVGDEADFVLEYKHPAETIVSINKTR